LAASAMISGSQPASCIDSCDPVPAGPAGLRDQVTYTAGTHRDAASDKTNDRGELHIRRRPWRA
jgi:hypothetical protein